MSGRRPVVVGMAREAQGGGGIVHHKKFSVLIVMRIVTGRALHLAAVIEPHFVFQRRGIFQFAIRRGEVRIVHEGDRVRLRQVRPEIARAGGHGRDVALHGNGCAAAVHQSQRDGSVMATQTSLGGAVGLTDCGVQGRA